jgi:hypothetical protein
VQGVLSIPQLTKDWSTTKTQHYTDVHTHVCARTHARTHAHTRTYTCMHTRTRTLRASSEPMADTSSTARSEEGPHSCSDTQGHTHTPGGWETSRRVDAVVSVRVE